MAEEALDYLGRQQPIGQQTTSGPAAGAGGLGGGPVTGISGPGPGSGALGTASNVVGGAFIPPTLARLINSGGPNALQLALQALKGTGTVENLYKALTGNTGTQEPTPTTTPPEFTSEPGPGATGIGEIPGPGIPVDPGSIPSGVGELPGASIPSGVIPEGATGLGEIPGASIPSFGSPELGSPFGELPGASIPSFVESFGAGFAPESLGEAISAAQGIMGEASPIWSLLTAAVNILGPHELPLQGLFESIFGLGPTKQWLDFPQRLHGTLDLESQSNLSLANALATAQGPDAIQKAISDWKSAIGQRVGGFGEGSGPFDIPDEPGAGGLNYFGKYGGNHAAHEGGNLADFSPDVYGLRAMEQAAMAGASPQDRVAAYIQAAQAQADALKAANLAEQQRRESIYQPEDPSNPGNIGSA